MKNRSYLIFLCTLVFLFGCGKNKKQYEYSPPAHSDFNCSPEFISDYNAIGGGHCSFSFNRPGVTTEHVNQCTEAANNFKTKYKGVVCKAAKKNDSNDDFPMPNYRPSQDQEIMLKAESEMDRMIYIAEYRLVLEHCAGNTDDNLRRTCLNAANDFKTKYSGAEYNMTIHTIIHEKYREKSYSRDYLINAEKEMNKITEYYSSICEDSVTNNHTQLLRKCSDYFSDYFVGKNKNTSSAEISPTPQECKAFAEEFKNNYSGIKCRTSVRPLTISDLLEPLGENNTEFLDVDLITKGYLEKLDKIIKDIESQKNPVENMNEQHETSGL